jgi:hypothetical protein
MNFLDSASIMMVYSMSRYLTFMVTDSSRLVVVKTFLPD